MLNFINLLRKVYKKPSTIPVADIGTPEQLSDHAKEMLKKFGTTVSASDIIMQSTAINFERENLYRELDRAQIHWLMGSSVEYFSDVASAFSTIHNATAWVTADNRTYERELNEFLETIGIEEKIYDWTWTVAMYGDLFVEIQGAPGIGITSINDSEHPLHVSRVDDNGTLVGFYQTPYANVQQNASGVELLPPWKYAHFRLLGARKRRAYYETNSNSSYNAVSILSPDKRRITTRYGTSILTNALPSYKRLRLAEDSLLLARLTRGILRYIYKVKVSGSNIDAVGSIIDEYVTTLKRGRGLDTSASGANFDSTFNPMVNTEDIIVPVWDDVNDLQIEEVGGKTDIKWITDIEELRKQTATSLRLPLGLLGGFADEATGTMGGTSLERLDIRFARTARQLQRAIRDGLKRMCQVHLAFLGMDPDPGLFEVQMTETSTAEEEEIKEALDTSVDVAGKFMEMFDNIAEKTGKKFDKIKIFEYLNTKLFKLSDFNLNDFIIMDDAAFGVDEESAVPAGPTNFGGDDEFGDFGGDMEEPGLEEPELDVESPEEEELEVESRERLYDKIMTNLDFNAMLPTDSSIDEQQVLTEKYHKEILNEDWYSLYGDVKIVVEKVTDK